MPYDNDPRVIAWFERALADTRPRVRRHALELLEHVDNDRRSGWLARAESDPDPRVSATAALVSAVLSVGRDSAGLELLESDLSAGIEGADLEWEWEYALVVCRGTYVPSAVILAWIKEEDDSAAKQIALMKTFPMTEPERDSVAIIVDKRLVTRYTRSARSMIEARSWHNQGRPRYTES